MNLIINDKCNNNCSFCFAKHVKSNLSVHDLEYIISKDKFKPRIKIMGGEPTLHEDFSGIMGYLSNLENPMIMASNFLFESDDVTKSLIRFQKKKDLLFLINVSESKNLDLVVSNIKETVLSEFTAGFTLTENWEYYRPILGLINHDTMSSVRVSIPNHDKNVKVGELANKGYIKLIEKFVEWCRNNGKVLYIDCCLYPCLFKNKEEIDKFYNTHGLKFSMGCSSGPLILYKQGNEIYGAYCYSAMHIYDKLSTHDKIIDLYKHLTSLRKFELETKHKLPEKCGNCKFYLKECAGPCSTLVK